MNLLTRVALIGADPRDDQDMRTNKALLVITSLLILPISLIWGSLYLAFGSPVGWVPYLYFVVLVGALVLFAYNHNFRQLLADRPDRHHPGADAVDDPAGRLPAGRRSRACGASWRRSVRSSLPHRPIGMRWYIAFAAVFVESGIVGVYLGPIPPPLPIWFTTTMLALNVTDRRHDRVHVAGALRPAAD